MLAWPQNTGNHISQDLNFLRENAPWTTVFRAN